MAERIEMNKIVKVFYDVDEPYAGAYMEKEDLDVFRRAAYAHSVFLEKIEMPKYLGGKLYPCGKISDKSYAVFPTRSQGFAVNKKLLDEKSEILYPFIADDIMTKIYRDSIHTKGLCFIHSLPHYGRIISEGLDSYRERIIASASEAYFKEGLLTMLEGIASYRERCISYLEDVQGDKDLIAALKKVPFKPAENVYEAIVSWNFIFHMDDCDNVGRLDQDLLPLWKGENIEPLLREFFEIVDRADGFSASIGPDYNGITLQCLRAIKGLRRPQLELRITKDMPEEYWNAAIESLAEGGTNPTLYNEEGYYKAFKNKFPEIPDSDFKRFCGVGCTETSLAGLTYAGSLDADIHLPYIFLRCLREKLVFCKDFDSFYRQFIVIYKEEVKIALNNVYQMYKLRAELRGYPMRTLLVDDCIDKGIEFNKGGTRYSWGMINFAGIVNLIEDMNAVRELVFDRKIYKADDFIEKLEADDPVFRAECKKCAHFGINDEKVDRFAERIMTEIFGELEHYSTYLGGKYLPASIMSGTCVSAGENIPATPDGREADAPVGDSISAIHGNDTEGITAMLNSCTALPQHMMVGTPVLNLKMEKDFLKMQLRNIAMGYFAGGGLQMQITCLSKADLEDAMIHPEKHSNLIVRVGGYSEYFVRLSKDFQRQIISRKEYV